LPYQPSQLGVSTVYDGSHLRDALVVDDDPAALYGRG